ncbi:MAG: peptidase S9 prolyl oligopeptidase [Alphaproteobacteria bacterium]|nr:MAG: peptidase S9 prolyl oligopeptidase [Caulobacteraceae bacterium]TPW07481.1 MAG: peptidase S9 prolyl oligopeptidase [Alphaproteobacteria bacterium]
MTARFLLAIVCAFALGAPAVAQPPPASVYGRLPNIDDAAISPDGRHVAMIVTGNNQTYTRIYDLDASRVVLTVASPKDHTLRSIGWANETTATFVLSTALTWDQSRADEYGWRDAQRLFEFFRVGTITLPDGRMKLMMEKENGSWANTRLDDLQAPIVGDAGFGRMLGRTSPTRDGRVAIYRVNLLTGDGRIQQSASPRSWDMLLDESGRLVARTESQENTNRWKLFSVQGDAERQIGEDESETGAPPPLLGLLADGRLATLETPDGGDRVGLYGVDLATGAHTLVHEAPRHDITGAIADPWTRRIVGAQWTEDLPKQHFFDPGLAAIAGDVTATFEGGYALVLSWSRDMRRILVFGEGVGNPGAYYVYEPAEKRLRKLGALYPELPPEGVSSVSVINYPARDGVRIPAYLTIPNGLEPRNLPLVVLVHGGPHARDSWTFDWWAQFLASRGYMVLQPNFRGSSGYGDAWLEAGRREWGGRMQTDVEDGVAALVRSGRVDARRVCIVGASYGGYAALAGAALTPERYACAVSVNGVSDLSLMLQQEVSGDANGPTADFWQLSIGNRAEDAARIRAVSPANLAANVRAPILLMHSTEDSVVPPEQTKIMARRLRDAGKSARVVVLTGDDHWLSAAATRTQMLEEIETFLAQHLAAPAAHPAFETAHPTRQPDAR